MSVCTRDIECVCLRILFADGFFSNKLKFNRWINLNVTVPWKEKCFMEDHKKNIRYEVCVCLRNLIYRLRRVPKFLYLCKN